MEKFINWLTQKPERFFGTALILFAAIILICDHNLNFNSKEDWKGVLTEAHGMLLDILVFGILVSIYDRIRVRIEKIKENERLTNEKIERYFEEIDDFRYWKDDEARVRLIGNIKRLQRLGVMKLDLSECNLTSAILNDLKLVASNFNFADLSSGFFRKVDFSNCEMRGGRFANCSFGNLYDFDGANLADDEILMIGEESSVKFNKANLLGANFSDSHHRKTHFEGAYLVAANFSDTVLMDVHFEGTTLIDNIGGEDFLARFDNCHLLNCVAYTEQKDDFIRCGAKIDGMSFINNPNGIN